MENIYVRLLDEGTVVYRPVPATKISYNLYKLEGSKIYDPDENWEFTPNTLVLVEEINLQGEDVLIAVKQHI